MVEPNGTGRRMIMERGFVCELSSSLIIGVIVALTGTLSVQTSSAEEQPRAPILIPGIQEPEEMRVEPFPINKVVLTAPEQMLGEAMKNESDPRALLPALNHLLAQYPDFRTAMCSDWVRFVKAMITLRLCPISATRSNS
jgi:hypothetical protein